MLLGYRAFRDKMNKCEGLMVSTRAVTVVANTYYVLLEMHQEGRSEAFLQQLLQKGNYGRPGVCSNLVVAVISQWKSNHHTVYFK